MQLQGSLDVFALPEVLLLLRSTRQTGALHVTRGSQRGIVRVAGGTLSGANSDTSRQSLVHRLVGGGQLSDAALVGLADIGPPGCSLIRSIRDTGTVDRPSLLEVAGEQAVDAVFDMCRWTDGDFTLAADKDDPDDIGLRLPVAELLAAVSVRIERWPALASQLPTRDAILRPVAALDQDPSLTRHERALVTLIDGRRTLGDLVRVCGRGEYAIACLLSPLLERGMVAVAGEEPGELAAALVRRQSLIAGLESPVSHDTPAAAPPPPALDPPAWTPPAFAPLVLEPALPSTRPPVATESAHPRPSSPAHLVTEPAEGAAEDEAAATEPNGDQPSQLAPAQVARVPAHRDEGVNRSMVLRLIAGVQDL